MNIAQYLKRHWHMLLVAALIGAALPLLAAPAPAQAACSWKTPWECIPGVDDGSGDDGTGAFDCREAPSASRPDSGLAGWFASQPKNPSEENPFADKANVSMYDVYGYAGYDYATYDLGCGPDAVREPGAVTTTTIANLLYAPALWLVALDNSVREYAYNPDSMWGWTNDLVKRATTALRDRVFTPWGAVVLAIVGLWLLWGARGGNVSGAVTTAGWAILVMALVTVVASYPLQTSRVADDTLTGALGQVSGVLTGEDPDDDREPAVRSSGVLTETILYHQWLRGTLGSADSDVAKKYGPDLYKARSISWAEAQEIEKDSKKRDQLFTQKAKLWNKTAEKIKNEDPEAYEYLVGRKGTERIGAALLAFISALVVTPFDIMASLLILVAFLIIRLAVIFLPVLGTVGILMPASGPLRGMIRTVFAAIINCVIFGCGSAVFLLALEIITGTESLAGWQQVLLLWLSGLILWLILRPYRRLTQLTGMDPFGSVSSGFGKMHKTVFKDMKHLGLESTGSYIGDSAALSKNDKKRAERMEAHQRMRPESYSRPASAGTHSDVGAADEARAQQAGYTRHSTAPSGAGASRESGASKASSVPSMRRAESDSGEYAGASGPGRRERVTQLQRVNSERSSGYGSPTASKIRSSENYPVYRPEEKSSSGTGARALPPGSSASSQESG